MAKQLLGKEVTAALNETYQRQMWQLLRKKALTPHFVLSVSERIQDDISYEKRCNKAL